MSANALRTLVQQGQRWWSLSRRVCCGLWRGRR